MQPCNTVKYTGSFWYSFRCVIVLDKCMLQTSDVTRSVTSLVFLLVTSNQVSRMSSSRLCLQVWHVTTHCKTEMLPFFMMPHTPKYTLRSAEPSCVTYTVCQLTRSVIRLIKLVVYCWGCSNIIFVSKTALKQIQMCLIMCNRYNV